MATYATPLAGLEGNVIYGKDGSVWVNFLLEGINVNPYNPSKVSSVQAITDDLFTSLSAIDSSDFLILGIKSQIRPEDIMAQCAAGLPGLQDGAYADLVTQLNVFFRKIKSGELASFERLYWLSVAMPVGLTTTEKILGKMVITDPHDGISIKSVRAFNASVMKAIPEKFHARPTTPQHVRWVFDRARLRGLEVPFAPKTPAKGEKPDKAAMKFGANSFPQVNIDQAADTAALTEKFIEDLADRLNERGAKALKSGKSSAVSSFLNNFRSLTSSRMLAIRNLETNNADFPDGYTSHQVMMGIASPPTRTSTAVNSFTYIVDQAIGCDADFALRITFDASAVSKETASKALRDMKSEDLANSRDELDVEDYADDMNNVRELHATVKAESNPIGMKVAALFAFAHPDMDYLKRRAATLSKTFGNAGFTTYQAVGGQHDMWMQMLPGVTRSRLTDDLMMTTTSYLFSGCMPLRKTVIGDSKGVPVAINTENALGQIILWDVLNATDKGNASITVCGAQGAGKSYLIKLLLGYMLDLNRYVYLIDQHKHGEYEVFATTLSDSFVFDVTGRQASLDPLKLYPSEDGTAAQVFMDLWLPLLNIAIDSPEAVALSRMLKHEFRNARKLHSTRALIDYIRRNPVDVSESLSGKFAFWGEQTFCSALIDPVDHGEVINLPPLDAQSHCVVFRTHNLAVYRGNNIAEAEPSERYAAVMYNAIARAAAYRFSQIKGACAFFGDELHFLDGNDRVLDRLIRTPDRTGRKDGNFIVGGSQLASDFGSQYDMIKRKFILRQETHPNAVEALEWADMPATEYLVSRMLEETSPPDPDDNNMPTRGREGEGWFNDGSGNIARIKVLQHLRADRGRMADTTSSRMIRAEELVR
ncbi:MAG: hypothetical protein E6R04_04520 [Spirochaetes bacterium]|nr:MAG: hypothetical protein E6R04_04520 [Spirochaetota bacterium]